MQGVPIDKVRVAPGGRLEGGMLVAYAHTRQCAPMPSCCRSGYGVFTYDNEFLSFDAAGGEKAAARAEVTGEIRGDTIRVVRLELF